MTYITFISYFILSYYINHIINIINDSYIRYTYSPVTYSYIQTVELQEDMDSRLCLL